MPNIVENKIYRLQVFMLVLAGCFFLFPVQANSLVAPVPEEKPNSVRTDLYPLPSVKPIPSLKKPMSRQNATLYQRIFEHQERGEFKQADALISQLTDFRLRGHVLMQRYLHPTAYRSSFSELKEWLDIYADHPGAYRIYKLALARMPSDFKGPLRQPEHKNNVSGMLEVLDDDGAVYHSPKKRARYQRQAIKDLESQIRSDISHGAPTRAHNRLQASEAREWMDSIEYDQLLAQISNSYMHAGRLDKAYELALSAVQRSETSVPLAGWIGGLVAWRQGNYAMAAPLFERAAVSSYASSWTKSAAAYWASRAHMRNGHVKEVNKWLLQAARYPRTFYGLIALKALGWNHQFNWEVPEFTRADLDVLLSHPAASRAMALVASGQYHLAEAELRGLDIGKEPHLRDAVLAYAYHKDLPALLLRMAESSAGPGGYLYDSALYPDNPWEPKEGYELDRALINAIIRQESRFNPNAESHSGASGLMQIMPKTASHVAGKRRGYHERSGRHLLKNPEINLDIGQRYLQWLMSKDYIDDELFSLVIAYNAGPGNLRKWKREYADTLEDPLLFIECIPMAETRAFLERVMANYWIYRQRFNQPVPTLHAVTQGGWAEYVSLDHQNNPHRRADVLEYSSYKLAKN